MKLTAKKLLVETNFENWVDSLKNAELARDLNAFEALLAPYFGFDISHFDYYEQAYLHRFLGFFYIHFGKAKNVNGYQELGRDHLTSAIAIFEDIGLADEAIEAEISLGWSYYLRGETENFEPFLINSLCRENQSAEAVIAIKVSLLIVYYREKRINEGFQLINELSAKVNQCSNRRLVCQFYTNSGLVCRVAGEFEKAVEYYQKAISAAIQLGNLRFEGQTLNCLAYCLMSAENFDDALFYSDKAINVFGRLNDTGLKADCLDTKATILLKLGHFDDALDTIIKAIAFFRKSESYLSYAEALWNKIEILVKLKKKFEIFETFRELSNLAHEHLELKYQLEYYRKFGQMNFMFFGRNFKENRQEFEKQIIEPVLNEYGTVEAARRLGFPSHQTLSNMVARNPLIKSNSKRKPRSDGNDIREFSLKQPFSFPQPVKKEYCVFFRCQKRVGRILFGRDEDYILMVYHDGTGSPGDKILMKQDNLVFIAELVVEDNCFYFVDLETGNTVGDRAEIYGRIIGYTPISGSTEETIYFKKI